jgi:hypothetical protein
MNTAQNTAAHASLSEPIAEYSSQSSLLLADEKRLAHRNFVESAHPDMRFRIRRATAGWAASSPPRWRRCQRGYRSGQPP